MIPLPNSAVALRFGYERIYFVKEAHRIAQEHYDLFDRMWELCDMNGWQKCEATIPMMGKIMVDEPDPDLPKCVWCGGINWNKVDNG